MNIFFKLRLQTFALWVSFLLVGFFCKDAPHDMTRRVLGRFYAACAYLRMYQSSRMERVLEFDDCMRARSLAIIRSSGRLEKLFEEILRTQLC